MNVLSSDVNGCMKSLEWNWVSMDVFLGLNNADVDANASLKYTEQASTWVQIRSLHIVSWAGKDAVWLLASGREEGSRNYLFNVFASKLVGKHDQVRPRSSQYSDFASYGPKIAMAEEVFQKAKDKMNIFLRLTASVEE